MNLEKNNKFEDNKNRLDLFINQTLIEIEKFENQLQTREDTVWNIVDIAVRLNLFDLIQSCNVPQVIKDIIDLACDLEIPDEAYQGDVNIDMKKLIDLVKNYRK